MLADYLFVDPDQRQTPPTDYDPAISGETTVDVTERCVLRLGVDGWIVTEIAPGVDFDRDVQARCRFRLHRSSDMRSMDPSLFAPEPINLKLQPAT